MADIKCIDVSTWQGNIDWDKVKKAGYEYAIIRAGFGREVSQKDNKFEANYKNAKAAGVKLGAYWYSYADSVTDAEKEAKACLSVLKGKTFELPVYYDLEDNSQVGFGKTTLTNIAKKFCDTLKSSGYSVGVYANANWFKNHLDYSGLKKLYSIWLAQYNSTAQYECDIWQYSSSGSVKGISGNVDMNTIYNTDIIKIIGDVNMDNTVNIKDATLIQKYVAKSKKLTAKQLERADMNGDGKVNVKDATAIQKQIAKK